MVAQPSAGRFVWYELMTDDRARSEAFYRSVVGWTARPFDGPMPYSLFSAGRDDVAGMTELPEELSAQGVPPNWLPYIGTSDIHETVARVVELGGTVMRGPTRIDGRAMRFAVVADPQGAIFRLLQGNTEAPPFPPAVGGFSWHELLALDHEKASQFYSALFDWQMIEDMDAGPVGTYRLFGRDGARWGGMFDKPAELAAPPHWLMYVRVADLDSAVHAVAEGGGKVLNGPMDVPGGDRIAQCDDPRGAGFALHQVMT